MTGIALEGGAKCAAFTAGVLDVFMENGISFPVGCGVSAGAGCLVNYRSLQPGRSLGLMLPSEGKDVAGVKNIIKNRRFIDLDMLTDPTGFDGDAFEKSPMRTECVATCCETGKAEYFSVGGEPTRMARVLKASCSVPVLCPPVEIDGRHYVDGSVSDSVGAMRLLDGGCERVVAVLTRPLGAGRTDYRRLSPLLKKLYGEKYPELYRCLMKRAESSAKEMKRLEKLRAEGRIFVLRPGVSAPPKFTGDEKLICSFYEHGRQRALEKLGQIGEFLK